MDLDDCHRPIRDEPDPVATHRVTSSGVAHLVPGVDRCVHEPGPTGEAGEDGPASTSIALADIEEDDVQGVGKAGRCGGEKGDRSEEERKQQPHVGINRIR